MADKTTPPSSKQNPRLLAKLTDLPSIYGYIFSVLGFILACVFSFLVSSLWVGYLGLHVYKGGEIPEGKLMMIFVLMGVSVVMMTILSAARGVQYGRDLQENGGNAGKKKKAVIRLIAVMFLFLGVFLYILSAQKFGTAKTGALTQAVSTHVLDYNILNLELKQEGDGMRISGELSGSPSEEYELNVLFVATNFMQEFIFSRPQRIRLNAPTQTFSVYVTFDEIATAYRRKLSDYIPVFDRFLDLDEIFSIQAVLIPVKALPDVPSSQTIPANVDPVLLAKKTVLAQFNFHCQFDECLVVQEETESESVQP